MNLQKHLSAPKNGMDSQDIMPVTWTKEPSWQSSLATIRGLQGPTHIAYLIQGTIVKEVYIW